MTRILGCSTRYVQGMDELKNLHLYTKPYGSKVMVIIDDFVYPMLKDQIINESLNGVDVIFEKMNYDVTYKNANKIKDKALAEKVEVIVAVGGGKTIDISKVVAHLGQLPIGIVPTAASVDAPVTSLSVIHDDNGNFEEYLFYPKSPDFILVDSKIIANAPVRLLVAGMGDALGTYFEARSTSEANGLNLLGAKPTKTSTDIARLCYETLTTKGLEAKQAVAAHKVNEAVEDIIEANILMSGVGAESGGLAAAHAFFNASHVLENFHSFMHGEIVSFGTVIQLFLENRIDEVDEVINFCVEVGLPAKLKDYGFEETIKEEEWMPLCVEACAPTDTMINVPVKVTPELLFKTIKEANDYSENFQASKVTSFESVTSSSQTSN